MTATAVYLLRHGRTASNASGTWQGQADVPLDDVGRHEATLAGQALRDLAPARVVSSDLVRAAETARALGAVVGLEPELDPRLREVAAGQWEGLTRTEIEERWPEELALEVRRGRPDRWRRADQRGGARFAGALREHAAGTDGVLVLVGHGAPSAAPSGSSWGCPTRAARSAGCATRTGPCWSRRPTSRRPRAGRWTPGTRARRLTGRAGADRHDRGRRPPRGAVPDFGRGGPVLYALGVPSRDAGLWRSW